MSQFVTVAAEDDDSSVLITYEVPGDWVIPGDWRRIATGWYPRASREARLASQLDLGVVIELNGEVL